MFKNYKILFILIFNFLAGFVRGDILDYIIPYNGSSFSNYGGIGLIQNPSARFLNEGSIAFSWSHNDPYLRGSIVAYPFNWMEASFQYTDINNALYSNVPEFSGSQSLKDKSFDAKLMLLKERALIPQVALGFRDLGGTGLFASEYFVINKKISKFIDISIGVGWGNLNRNFLNNPLKYLDSSFEFRNDSRDLGGKFNFSNFFSGNAGYFGGAELSIPNTNGLKIKLELDGTNYITESMQPLEQDSRINIGITYPISNNLILKSSYVRGNTLNFGFSYALTLGNKNPLNVRKESRKILDNQEIIKRVTSKSDENLYKASLLYLKEEGLSLQKASIEGNSLHVVYSHARYRSPVLAAGRAIKVIDEISPEKIEHIKVSEVNAGLGIYSVNINRELYNHYQRLDSPEVISQYISKEAFHYKNNSYKFNPKVTYPAYFIKVGPELVNQIGGPDGFFFGRLDWTAGSEILFQRNLSLISKFSYGLIDNMDELKLSSDSILPPVRTDIVSYLKESRGFSIERLQLNFFKQLTPSIFVKLSGGIFESMFSGYGFETLYRPYDKNYGVGLELWKVHQRDYDQMFNLRNYNTITGHLSYYYHHPTSNILFSIKGGKYLAKDSGFTFDFSRIFRSGLRMGVYFSLTDISEEEFGEGSFDKGFYFWVPVELFSSRYFKRTFGWGLRPITRDGAQSLIYGYPLWGVTDASSRHRFDRRIDEIFE